MKCQIFLNISHFFLDFLKDTLQPPYEGRLITLSLCFRDSYDKSNVWQDSHVLWFITKGWQNVLWWLTSKKFPMESFVALEEFKEPGWINSKLTVKMKKAIKYVDLDA